MTDTVAQRDPGKFFYEMALSREDFLRLLPIAVGREAFHVEGGGIRAAGDAPSWRIRLEERPGRRFGPVRLPVLGVTLDLDGLAEFDRPAFVRRFLLGFQRAGG